MRTLYLERSVSTGRNGEWIETLDLDPPPERFVVGLGPGSFAGIRAALSFAIGYAAGSSCEVWGLPSPCALAGEGPLAVVGDARRGLLWVALFDGFKQERDIFQVPREEIASALPPHVPVTTPDAARLDEFLRTTFPDRYVGPRVPTAAGLQAFAERNPNALVKDPRPIYLNPAVRA